MVLLLSFSGPNVSVPDDAFRGPRFYKMRFSSFIWSFDAFVEKHARISESGRDGYQLASCLLQRWLAHRTLEAPMHVRPYTAKMKACWWNTVQFILSKQVSCSSAFLTFPSNHCWCMDLLFQWRWLMRFLYSETAMALLVWILAAPILVTKSIHVPLLFKRIFLEQINELSELWL